MLANEQTGRGRATLARWTRLVFLGPCLFLYENPYL
jgi:hypothetical protein